MRVQALDAEPEVADEYGKGGHPSEPITYFCINGKAFPATQPLWVKKDDWYVWKDRQFEPDFYFPESMTKGPGIFDVPSHEGEYVVRGSGAWAAL